MRNTAAVVEDKPVIEAPCRNVADDVWTMKPLSIGIDMGGARARRIVEKRTQKEAAAGIAIRTIATF